MADPGRERPRTALLTRAPALSGAPVLTHGDFHYGSRLFAGDQVRAIVYWEIADVGDPLCDLGDLAVATLRRRYAPRATSAGFVRWLRRLWNVNSPSEALTSQGTSTLRSHKFTHVLGQIARQQRPTAALTRRARPPWQAYRLGQPSTRLRSETSDDQRASTSRT